MKFYRCINNYYDLRMLDYAYRVGQICAFKKEELFFNFDEYFEEIEL